ncbi:MAG: hypothetical protein P9L94_17875 [Candidatus Hinthialibacter antarcticus]|nr:hypothetical protein [Candidatus Hinthialibacter antarcticus]
MSKFVRRKILEDKLQSAIKRGEHIACQDPEVKKMIEGFRQMYQEDDGGMLSALGMPGPSALPPSGEPSPIQRPPESRIPQLIFMLDQLVKKQEASKPLKKSGYTPRPKTVNVVPSTSSVQGSRKPFLPSKEKDDFLTEFQTKSSDLKALDSEIAQSKEILNRVRQDEQAIHNQQGTYSNTANRIKAERLLRELPGKIIYLQEKKLEIEKSR